MRGSVQYRLKMSLAVENLNLGHVNLSAWQHLDPWYSLQPVYQQPWVAALPIPSHVGPSYPGINDEAPAPVEWRSTRPPLEYCDEKAFLDDLCQFLEHTGNKKLDRKRFPEVVVNSRQLDLFNLYK